MEASGTAKICSPRRDGQSTAFTIIASFRGLQNHPSRAFRHAEARRQADVAPGLADAAVEVQVTTLLLVTSRGTAQKDFATVFASKRSRIPRGEGDVAAGGRIFGGSDPCNNTSGLVVGAVPRHQREAAGV